MYVRMYVCMYACVFNVMQRNVRFYVEPCTQHPPVNVTFFIQGELDASRAAFLNMYDIASSNGVSGQNGPAPACRNLVRVSVAIVDKVCECLFFYCHVTSFSA